MLQTFILNRDYIELSWHSITRKYLVAKLAFLSIFTHTNFRIFCLPYCQEISVREQISKLIQIISYIFCEIQSKKAIIKGQSKQKAGNFLYLRGLPLPFNAILGGSPRISFAFSFTHSLTNK